MYRHVAVAALAFVSLPFAASQLMDLDAIATAPDPVLVTPPVDVTENIPADVRRDRLHILIYCQPRENSTRPNTFNNYAFASKLAPGNDNGVGGLTLSQPLTVCGGSSYSVTIDHRFDAPTSGAGGAYAVKIVYPFKASYGSVSVSSTVSGTGSWNTTGGSFQAVQDVTKDVFSVVFSCAAGLSDTITVDDVVVTLEPPGYNAY